MILDCSTPSLTPPSCRRESSGLGLRHHPLTRRSPPKEGEALPGFRILPVILPSELQSHRSTRLLRKGTGTINSPCCPATGSKREGGTRAGIRAERCPAPRCGWDASRWDAALAFLVRNNTGALAACQQEAFPSGEVIYNGPLGILCIDAPEEIPATESAALGEGGARCNISVLAQRLQHITSAADDLFLWLNSVCHLSKLPSQPQT